MTVPTSSKRFLELPDELITMIVAQAALKNGLVALTKVDPDCDISPEETEAEFLKMNTFALDLDLSIFVGSHIFYKSRDCDPSPDIYTWEVLEDYEAPDVQSMAAIWFPRHERHVVGEPKLVLKLAGGNRRPLRHVNELSRRIRHLQLGITLTGTGFDVENDKHAPRLTDRQRRVLWELPTFFPELRTLDVKVYDSNTISPKAVYIRDWPGIGVVEMYSDQGRAECLALEIHSKLVDLVWTMVELDGFAKLQSKVVTLTHDTESPCCVEAHWTPRTGTIEGQKKEIRTEVVWQTMMDAPQAVVHLPCSMNRT
ncbi:hypothetical protein LTR37_019323 [Vermiconidia calcicola]|uniref:Uncharacterized protein n=1 Tax=Vermiconidia calcicola TaxID=1690605 RepID=A0ACC3MEC7_9PEZI|nr:hypothetical protein LTR37_019323 [Vermiconidia calcicola]